MGIVDIAFQSAETGKSATPTGHLDLHFAPFAVSYELFPTVKSKKNWISSPSTTRAAKRGHYAAYSRAAGTCYPTWCTCLHYKRFENCWKRFAERLLWTTTVVSHHALVERGKDKTVRNAESLKRSIGTVMANVPNCILRSRIVYIDTQPASCLWYLTPAPRVI